MRYILAILGIVAVIITFIVIIVSLNNGNKTTPLPKMADLSSTQAVVRLTADGPINADENHRSVRITIDADSRTIDIIQGYQGSVIASETLTNNDNAYKQFLAALDRSGYAIERKTSISSEEGLCPLSNRYVIELYNTPNKSSSKNFRRWETTCSGRNGNFGGKMSIVRQLFKDQFPDYSVFASKALKSSLVTI